MGHKAREGLYVFFTDFVKVASPVNHNQDTAGCSNDRVIRSISALNDSGSGFVV